MFRRQHTKVEVAIQSFFFKYLSDGHLTIYFVGPMKFTKCLLYGVIYVKNAPPPQHSEALLIRMSAHVIILPLIQPLKKPQETISCSKRIYKQSLLNSLKKETDAMLTHKHLKKKLSESLKIEQHCPIDQKLFKRFF